MTEDEYKKALAEINLLWDEEGEEARQRFEALVLEIEAYEMALPIKEHYPIEPSDVIWRTTCSQPVYWPHEDRKE